MKYVTIQKLSELSGYTVGALRRKIDRGQLLQGVHFIKSPDGRIHFDLEAYQSWVEGKQVPLASKRADCAYGSSLAGVGGGAVRR